MQCVSTTIANWWRIAMQRRDALHASLHTIALHASLHTIALRCVSAPIANAQTHAMKEMKEMKETHAMRLYPIANR